jgi:hypothetical protein
MLRPGRSGAPGFLLETNMPGQSPLAAGKRRHAWIAAAILVALIAAGVAWYIISPGWTVKAMVEAAQGNDEARFSSYVDYEALRADMKADFMKRLQEDAKRDANPEAKLAIAMGQAVVGPMVDAMVSPSGMKAAFAALAAQDQIGKAAGGKGKAGGDDSAAGGEKAELPEIRRLGFNRFIVSGKQTPGSGLVFERRGLSWKLAGIEIPAQPQPQSSPR